MKLFDGSAVMTELASYAYISLGSVRVVKLDETARVSINKSDDDKKLLINLEYGRIFFDIAKPLTADEELTIKTPTIVAGIRGTSGELGVSDQGDYIRLFSGLAEIDTAEGEQYEIQAHEQVSTYISSKGEITSEKITFTEANITAFIAEEAAKNANGFAETLTANGFDVAAVGQDYVAADSLSAAQGYYKIPQLTVDVPGTKGLQIMFTNVLSLYQDSGYKIRELYPSGRTAPQRSIFFFLYDDSTVSFNKSVEILFREAPDFKDIVKVINVGETLLASDLHGYNYLQLGEGMNLSLVDTSSGDSYDFSNGDDSFTIMFYPEQSLKNGVFNVSECTQLYQIAATTDI